MRLTLRTLLAHEHGLLEEEQAALIAQKIEQSPFVRQLLRHLKDRAARAEIVPLSIDARGTCSLDRVVGYLDYALPAEDVVKLENECFASDRLLAEVAACHEILAEWLSTPTPLDPDLREHLYALMSVPASSLEPDIDEIAIDLPSLAYQSMPSAEPSVERKPEPDPLPKRRSLLGTALQLLALSACVTGLVALVVSHRDTVEQMIARHWQQKTTQPSDQEFDSHTVSPTGQPDPLPMAPPPERFVAQAVPLDQFVKPQVSPIEVESAAEVAATSFEYPIAPSVAPPSPSTDVFHVVNSAGVLCQRNYDQEWSQLGQESLGQGRLIVSPQGMFELRGNRIELNVGPVSEVRVAAKEEFSLRYGSIDLALAPGATFQMRAAGQEIVLVAREQAARVKIKTAPVSKAGIDFASDAMNQEVQIEGVGGPCEITLSSCRGPFTMEPGQKIAAHVNFGVRSDPSIVFAPWRNDFPEADLVANAVQAGEQQIAYLRQQLKSPSRETQDIAALMLAQLGEIGTLTDVWRSWEGQAEFQDHARQFRWIIAQDARLASQLKMSLEAQSPQYGSLIYRLVCGFSADQLSDATAAQLAVLLRHPEPAVRAWTEYQLNASGTSSEARLSRLEQSAN